jgi:hypothetical protein
MTARHPLLDRAMAADAPLPLRLLTARGAVPVPRPDLLPALVQFSSDADESVRAAARKTLQSFSQEELRAAISDPAVEGRTIDHVASQCALEGELLIVVLSHPAVSDEALCAIAGSSSLEALELLVSNQERLMKCPALVESLEANAALPGILRGRLADFRERFAAGGAAPTVGVAPGADIVTDEELRSLLQEVADLPFIAMDLGALIESDGMSASMDGALDAGPGMDIAWDRLRRMTGPQRLKVALRGGKEERTILVRDTNRIVAAAVMKNPRLTLSEVETFASLRSVHEDILRMIGQSREWMRNYSIVRNLVRNPKTPPGVAMNHVNRLPIRDLQFISRDHNVPEVVRRAARRHVETRERKTDKVT